jgi:hypothetical protein
MTLPGTLFLQFNKEKTDNFPLGKDIVLYMNNLKFLHPRMFHVSSLIEIGLLVLKKIL